MYRQILWLKPNMPNGSMPKIYIILFVSELDIYFFHRELLVFADNFIEQHFNEVVQSEEFFNLNGDQFKHLIANDRLTTNEEAVFESAMSWVRFDVERRKGLLADIMEHVR